MQKMDKCEILEILDKFEFFQGQRAGRELWANKPEQVQEEDLKNFCRDIQRIREYVTEAVPVVRGEWIAQGNTLTKFTCSVCEAKNYQGSENFCPKCGADMRKKVK